jgi:MoaA/NifB/PqqE/SkfB family radical SAM enzyme
MTDIDWHRVIEGAARLGVGTVQFIGGEPTLHPALPRLVGHALAHRMSVEVFTNLVHVTPRMWDTFTRPGVSLATSWYSSDPGEHATITRRPSHGRTAAGIAEAVRREIPLRVGVVGVVEGQRVDQAGEVLTSLGVPAEAIGYDDLRQVGRGVRTASADVTQLCGNCADGVLAVSPSGEVWPCVFSRWLPLGNVLNQPLADILAGETTTKVRGELVEAFAAQADTRPCNPGCNPSCGPQCKPISCGPRCNPMVPNCNPQKCNPMDKFCSPNYTPGKKCPPRDGACRPNSCRPMSPR